jgi:beta-lactamase regulating signal transducer with metallopeptidase domain
MESIIYNISQVLGISIIHSLWQGLLIYFILRLVFAGSPSMSAIKKYNLAVIAMLAIAACFVYTLCAETRVFNLGKATPAHLPALLPGFNLPVTTHYQPASYYIVARYLPYLCALYFAGLLANLLKFGLEWNKITQIKRSLICAKQMQQFINGFSKKLSIDKNIQIKFSGLIDVPCVIGYFKPLILLPVSLSVHLSACEVEAILLHELSHIKRNDYLVNMLQQFITLMLFFNPFTQLISRLINQERENACDDLVIEKTAKPLIYARALLKLEEVRKHNLQLALAVTGKKFLLLNRIERIMKTKKNIGNIRHLLIAIFLLAGSLSCIAWFNPKVVEAKEIATKVKSAVGYHLSVAANPVNTGEKTAPLAAIVDNKEFIVAQDSIKNSPLTDTSKHKKKADEKAQDNISELSKSTFSLNGFPSDSANKFFSSPEWNAQMEVMKKQREEMRKRFNSPEWKAQMDAMRKQGETMKKQFNSPQWKQQMMAMQKQFNSPQWKQQMENIQKQGELMKKQFDGPEWKLQMENMRKQGELMKKQFDSPEWKLRMENMQKQGEEMNKKFNSPEWKKQMEDMQKQGEEMSKKFNNPEWKKAMHDQNWILKDSVGGTKIYSPAKPMKKESN